MVMPLLYPEERPSTTTKTKWLAAIIPSPVLGWVPWMEWLPKLVSISSVSMPSMAVPPSTSVGPKERVCQAPSEISFEALVPVSS